MDQAAIEVSAALAGVRRRARLLEESRGEWSWRDLSVLLPLGLAVYLGLSNPSEISDSTLGLILFVSGIGAWQHNRLRARVDALSKLLAEVA